MSSNRFLNVISFYEPQFCVTNFWKCFTVKKYGGILKKASCFSVGKEINIMNETYSIKDIIKLLLGHLWLIVLIAFLGAAAGFCVSKFVLPLQYSSHITMYVQSYTGIAENTNNVNNISNSKQLVNTYIEVLKDDAVMNAVGDQLSKQFNGYTISQNFSVSDSGKITPSSIRNCLAISSVTDTSAVKVTATAKNAEVAAAICNDLTKVAPQYVQDAVGVGSINIIDTAKVYNTPVAPNTLKNTLIGGIAGFMLIVLIIFLIDLFDNTIKDSDVLVNKYQKAIIGEIQQFGESSRKRKKSSAKDEYIKLTDNDVPFYVVESYKSIRTNITFSLSTFEKKVFAVSSANPGDGKSTTAANIAIALAQGGNKVLLIDADMRKSTQHRIFELKNKKGLSAAISKMSKLDECIQKNVMENLDIMTAGLIPPNPAELLASEQMTAILDELSKRYGVIIIDTPPVNVVNDAMELAHNISGILMVVRYANTADEDIDTVYKKIEFVKMNLLGFIMNDVKYRRHVDYKYGYYGSKHEKEADNKSVKAEGKK